MFNNSDEEKTFDEMPKWSMLFQSFDKTDISVEMASLPPTWVVVQISGHKVQEGRDHDYQPRTGVRETADGAGYGEQ